MSQNSKMNEEKKQYHKEHMRTYMPVYMEKNKEKIKAQKAEYYQKNKPTPEERDLIREAYLEQRKRWNATYRAKKKAALQNQTSC